MQFKVLEFEKLHTLRRHFKTFAGKHICQISAEPVRHGTYGTAYP